MVAFAFDRSHCHDDTCDDNSIELHRSGSNGNRENPGITGEYERFEPFGKMYSEVG